MNKNNIKIENCKELIDIRKNGKTNDWDGKKQKNVTLYNIMEDIDTIKDSVKTRVLGCGNTLWFNEYENGTKKIFRAYLCKYRLCPICIWRRAMKTFANTAKIMDYIKADGYQYIFLTLTVKNCLADDLKAQIDSMLKGWDKMTHRKAWKTVVKGYYRGLEVTRNMDTRSKSYGTFHPHLHVLLVVKKSYGHKGEYITKKEFKQMWSECMGLEYNPIVDVRAVKPNKDGDIIPAICEVTKYPIKDVTYIDGNDLDMSRETIATLDEALRGRRLVHYGGVLAKAQKELKIKDVDSDLDLIITGEEKEDSEIIMQSCYAFHFGFMQYRHVANIPYVADKDEQLRLQGQVEYEFRNKEDK